MTCRSASSWLLAAWLMVAAVPRAGAEDLDPGTAKALQQTQELLKDPAARAQAAQGDAQAAAVEKQVEQLGGTPQNTQAIYDLAADVLGNVAKDAQGDPDKMMQLLEKASKNPEAFGNQFTPEQKQKLRELSQKLPQAQPAIP